ncbi:MAG: class I SAM-dependent methyltransferase [Luteolibacter sp.]
MSQPYLSLEAELHDVFWNHEDEASEVALMADFLDHHPGKALEIGSGSGRLLIPLLEMGYDIEGLELSADMIRLHRQIAARRNLPTVVHQADMCRWSDGRTFSSLLAPAFTLQLARDPLATLCHWRSLLKNHGGLYLTLFMPYAELLGDLPENEWYEDHTAPLPDGRVATVHSRHRLDRTAQILHREHRYSISGEPNVYESRQTLRWFEHDQTLDLLAQAGFHLDHALLDFDPNSPALDPDNTDFGGILTYYASACA